MYWFAIDSLEIEHKISIRVWLTDGLDEKNFLESKLRYTGNGGDGEKSVTLRKLQQKYLK